MLNLSKGLKAARLLSAKASFHGSSNIAERVFKSGAGLNLGNDPKVRRLFSTVRRGTERNFSVFTPLTTLSTSVFSHTFPSQRKMVNISVKSDSHGQSIWTRSYSNRVDSDEDGISHEDIVESAIPFRLITLPGAGSPSSANKLPLMVKPLSLVSMGGRVRAGTDKFVLQQVTTEFLQRGGRSVDLCTGYEVDVLEEILHQTFFNDLNPDEVTLMFPLSFIEMRSGQVYNSLPTTSVLVNDTKSGPRSSIEEANEADASTNSQDKINSELKRKDSATSPEPYSVLKRPSTPESIAAAAENALMRRKYMDKFSKNPLGQAVAEEDPTLSPFYPFANRSKLDNASKLNEPESTNGATSSGISESLRALDSVEAEVGISSASIHPSAASVSSDKPLFRKAFQNSPDVGPEHIMVGTVGAKAQDPLSRLVGSLSSKDPSEADKVNQDEVRSEFEYKPKGRLSGLALSIEDEERRAVMTSKDQSKHCEEQPNFDDISSVSKGSSVPDLLKQLSGVSSSTGDSKLSKENISDANMLKEVNNVAQGHSSSSMEDKGNANPETSNEIVEHEIKISVPPIPVIEGGRVDQVPVSVAIGGDARERTHFKINEICRHLEAEGVDMIILRDIESIFSGESEQQSPVDIMKDLMLVFVALEEAVRDGKLRFYGISSSTFGRPEFADMLNLNSIFFLAQTAAYNVANNRPHLQRLPNCEVDQPLSQYKPDPRIPCHLRAVAGNFSILSPGFVTELTCWDAGSRKAVSTYALARKLGMLVFCDGPLDATPAEGAEVRMQSVESFSKEYVESMEKSLQNATNECYRLESMYFELARRTGLPNLPPPIDLCWGQFISTNADKLYNPIRWEEFYHRQLTPTLYRALGKLVVVPALDLWAREYRSAVVTLCSAFERFVNLSSLKVMQEISDYLDENCSEIRSIPTLEGKVLAITLALEFDSVLTNDLIALRSVADVFHDVQIRASKAARSVDLSSSPSSTSSVPPTSAATATTDASLSSNTAQELDVSKETDSSLANMVGDEESVASMHQLWGSESSPFKFNPGAMRNLTQCGMLSNVLEEGLPNESGVRILTGSVSNIDTPQYLRPQSLIPKSKAIQLVRKLNEELTPRIVQRVRDLSEGVLDLSQAKVTQLGYNLHLPPDQPLSTLPK